MITSRDRAAAAGLFRLELVDAVRGRLRRPGFFLAPFLLLLVLGVGAAVPALREAKQGPDVSQVAIVLTPDATAKEVALVAGLRSARYPELHVVDVADASAAVASQQLSAGLVIGPTSLDSLWVPASHDSRVGLARLKGALTREKVQAAREGRPTVALTTRVVNVVDTPIGQRRTFLVLLPLYVAMQLSGVGGVSVAAMRGSQASRSIEGLLALPVSRWTILVGKLGGAVVEGALRVLLLTAAVVGASLLSIRGLSVPVTTIAVVALLSLGLAVVAPLAALGLAVGVRVRTTAQEALGSGFLDLFGLFAVIGVEVSRGTGGSPLTRSVPVFGPLIALHGALAGSLGLWEVAASFAASLPVVAIGLVLARRGLDADGISLRDS